MIWQKKRKKKNRVVRRVVFCVLAVILSIGIAVSVKLGATLIQMKREAVELVSNASRDTFKASQTTLVYDAIGELIT